MAIPVYAWPPVPALSAEWDRIAPLRASYSGLTGRRYASADRPVRRIARVQASALAGDQMGAGYVLALKRLLAGGENLVRLNSYPLNRLSPSALAALQQVATLNWTAAGVPLNWVTGATSITWQASPAPLAAPSTSGGFPALTITGLPASTQIARPGDYLAVFANATDAVGVRTMVMAPSTSNASGVAVVRVFDAVPTGGRVELAARDTGVFRVSGEMPRAEVPFQGDWTYAWQFEEVFDFEVGGFAEVPNWWRAT